VRRLASALALGVLLVGCGGTGYVLRLGWTEARILARREPIAELLAGNEVTPALRERLRLVLAARRFAADRLGLSVGESYATFAEVGREAIVHVVSAAHRDRLEAVTWWYPIAGRVPYRGFFAAANAEAAAARLAADGLDVDVREAVAFSTLGWFADPLLSTTAEAAPVPLVETILHELFHATLYVPGASAFNESAATFVGHRGAIAFFCGGPGDEPGRCREARRRWAATRAEGAVLSRLADRLRVVFAAAPPPDVLTRLRRRLAARAVRQGARRGLALESMLQPPNNARLLANLVYVSHLEGFQALAPHGPDLRAAIQRLVTEARDAPDPFTILPTPVPRQAGPPGASAGPRRVPEPA
jgi:predicted aminopeptidase